MRVSRNGIVMNGGLTPLPKEVEPISSGRVYIVFNQDKKQRCGHSHSSLKDAEECPFSVQGTVILSCLPADAEKYLKGYTTFV